MKKTALYDKHVALGAKIVEFAGYQMPVSYAGIQIEHQSVREASGVFDVSHMGEFFVEGPNAQQLLSRVCSNDTSKLQVGAAQYNYFPNHNGGIVDDLIVYKIADEKFMLVVNAANIDKDWQHLTQENKPIGAELVDASEEYSLLAVQGPQAIKILQPLTSTSLEQIPFYQFRIGEFAGVKEVIISATGYTGAGGFELYCKNEDVAQLWDAVINAGIPPIGLAARDTLRLEMGYCLYGNDINDTTNPLEAGLGWVTKFNHDFIYSRELAAYKEAGLQQKLVGFKLLEKGVPRHDYLVVDATGSTIGIVTSGTSSPTLGYGIGLAYVPLDVSTPGSEIFIQIRNKSIKAEVVKLPFIGKA